MEATSSDAGSATKLPAVFLMVVSAGMCFIFFIDFFLFLDPDVLNLGREFRNQPELARMMRWFLPLLCVAVFCVNAFSFYCALQMYKLRRWPLALAGAIIPMIPLATSFCCVVGLPLGIWGVVVLNRAEVKAAFR